MVVPDTRTTNERTTSMTINRKLLGAAAFSLALAGGGAAGAVLGTPSISGAQDDSSETTTEDRPGRFGHRGEGLATAAEVLGMSEEDLRAALAEGSSIAEVAEEQGVDLQSVIDALVANATERLDELEAALPERMTELVNRTDWGQHERPGRGHHGPPLTLESAAETIGITADELRTALRDGSTVAEVAEANDVDAQTVIDALVADATTRIDAAVAAGDLDAERAEAMKAALPERITALVNGEGPGPRAGGPQGRHGGGPAFEDTAEADQAA